MTPKELARIVMAMWAAWSAGNDPQCPMCEQDVQEKGHSAECLLADWEREHDCVMGTEKYDS